MILSPSQYLPEQFEVAEVSHDGSLQRRAACGCLAVRGCTDYYWQVFFCSAHERPCAFCNKVPCVHAPRVGGGLMSEGRQVSVVV